MAERSTAPDLESFVRSRGPSLFRTAALLTHDDAAAIDLLVGALTQAQSRWKRTGAAPESFVRSILVTRFVRGHRSTLTPGHFEPADPSRVPPATGTPLRDPLAGLTQRQRAVTVLAAHHGQSLSQCAAALGISERATATAGQQAQDALGTDDLDAMAPLLAEVAESFTPADPETVLTRIGAVLPGVRRRRTIRWALAATAVLAIGASVSLLQDPDAPYGEEGRSKQPWSTPATPKGLVLSAALPRHSSMGCNWSLPRSSTTH